MTDAELSRLTIGALVERQALAYGDRGFACFPAADQRMTYAAFAKRVDLMARGLMSMGVRKGEHVAVWAPNSPEWLLLQYGLARVGAVIVPVPIAADAPHLEKILHHSDSTTLFLAQGWEGVDFPSIL